MTLIPFPIQHSSSKAKPIVAFDRAELSIIFALYGRFVAQGLWRDYAMNIGAEKAVFAIYRRTSEMPLYRIEKIPSLAQKQGLYRIVAVTGLILKRGHDLRQVMKILEKKAMGF